ncbi:MAG: hypothetical protein AAGL66_10110 [Pseudomonadota bacterium]
MGLSHVFRAAALVFFALFLSGCSSGVVIVPAGGDYGDAPDGSATGYPGLFAQNGQFPTLAANNGARTLDVNGARLGADASTESDANDPADSDGIPNLSPENTDSDDGIARMMIQVVAIPPPAFLDVDVSVPNGGQGGTYWLNVLIDLNMDGEWGGSVPPGNPEWVVKNRPVALAAGERRVERSDYFAYGNGNRLPDPAWMRVALTSEPVAGTDWDGSGEFSVGEIEDHLVRMPRKPDGTKLPVVAMQCGAPVKIFVAGQARMNFNCTVTELVGQAGSVRYWLDRRSGGVTISLDATLPPGASVPGTAPDGDGFVQTADIGAFGTVTLSLTATRGILPSTWSYGASAIDPMSVVDSQGVIAGATDSTGTITFVDEESLGELELEQWTETSESRRQGDQ